MKSFMERFGDHAEVYFFETCEDAAGKLLGISGVSKYSDGNGITDVASQVIEELEQDYAVMLAAKANDTLVKLGVYSGYPALCKGGYRFDCQTGKIVHDGDEGSYAHLSGGEQIVEDAKKALEKQSTWLAKSSFRTRTMDVYYEAPECYRCRSKNEDFQKTLLHCDPCDDGRCTYYSGKCPYGMTDGVLGFSIRSCRDCSNVERCDFGLPWMSWRRDEDYAEHAQRMTAELIPASQIQGVIDSLRKRADSLSDKADSYECGTPGQRVLQNVSTPKRMKADALADRVPHFAKAAVYIHFPHGDFDDLVYACFSTSNVCRFDCDFVAADGGRGYFIKRGDDGKNVYTQMDDDALHQVCRKYFFHVNVAMN